MRPFTSLVLAALAATVVYGQWNPPGTPLRAR